MPVAALYRQGSQSMTALTRSFPAVDVVQTSDRHYQTHQDGLVETLQKGTRNLRVQLPNHKA